MILCFSKPFDEVAGRERMRIDLPQPVRVEELLGILRTRIPSFQKYVRTDGDEVSSFYLLLVRGGEVLRLQDAVADGDIVRILPPLSGG